MNIIIEIADMFLEGSLRKDLLSLNHKNICNFHLK